MVLFIILFSQHGDDVINCLWFMLSLSSLSLHLSLTFTHFLQIYAISNANVVCVYAVREHVCVFPRNVSAFPQFTNDAYTKPVVALIDRATCSTATKYGVPSITVCVS